MAAADLLNELPLTLRLALSYCPKSAYAQTRSLFALDARLGQLLRQTSEPMLAQMKIAWWRDMLAVAPGERPRGDIVLESLTAWQGEEAALVALVDGWEELVGEQFGEAQAIAFARGRSRPFAALAAKVAPAQGETALLAAQRWALADLLANIPQEQEREAILLVAASLGRANNRLPRALRSLAVLDGLARRSLARGGAALLDGPGSMVCAMRLGMLGR